MNKAIVLFRTYKKEPKLIFALISIFLIALILRTYNYYERIYVYADNALFVQAAYYALKNGTIPQIGPFAQAPFFTGPWWLWILMIFSILPFGYLTPWYVMTFFSLVFILLLYITGKELYGKWFGILVAFLGNISTAAIDNSFMTWNAAADPLLGLVAVYFFIRYIKVKKPLFLFLLTFTVSLSTTIHFETFLLSGLIIVALLVNRPKIKEYAYPFIGGLIPVIPFLYFDLRFNWFWTIRVYEYITIGQGRIYVPNRWLTYAGEYWPQTWAGIIGGHTLLGYVIGALVVVINIISLRRFKENKVYFFILASFIISVIMLRYYRGERFFYYTNYAQGFVLIITSFIIWKLYTFKKFIGLLLLGTITVFTVNESIKNFDPRKITSRQVNNFINEIYVSYPNNTFDIYECPFSGSMISTPVSYKMYFDGKNTLDGIKIGVCNPEFKLSWSEISYKEIEREYGFMQKSTPAIYTDMTLWWIDNPPDNTSLYQ